MVAGQWGLIPWFAKEPKLKFPTNNARSEELEQKASYKDPWKRGQRCIIPAASFMEPNWESGKNQWWQFRRADGAPWGLAGLWATWTDKVTGEVHESFTMLTLNADEHPLMNRMHKPDPKLPPDKQDKRSVIPIELGDVDLWLGRHDGRSAAAAQAGAGRGLRRRPRTGLGASSAAVVMTMVLKVLGATPEEIAKGLRAAQAVLDQAGITDIQGARAQFDLEGWDVACDMAAKRRPGAEVFKAAAALDRARAAALAACCERWQAAPPDPDWSLDVM